jgi:hypothetical protein
MPARHRVTGDKRHPADRMTMHWSHNSGGRMYWCNCQPGFRVGDRVRYPNKGRKRPGWRSRSFIDVLLNHKAKA